MKKHTSDFTRILYLKSWQLQQKFKIWTPYIELTDWLTDWLIKEYSKFVALDSKYKENLMYWRKINEQTNTKNKFSFFSLSPACFNCLRTIPKFLLFFDDKKIFIFFFFLVATIWLFYNKYFVNKKFIKKNKKKTKYLKPRRSKRIKKKKEEKNKQQH